MKYLTSLDIVKKVSSDLKDLTDEEIVKQIQIEKDVLKKEKLMTYLISRCSSIIYHMAKKYYVKRSTRDDIRQEVLIGFIKAVKSYNEGCPFKPFAILCIRRHCISFIKSANRQKNITMNESISLNTQYYYKDGEKDDEFIDKLVAPRTIEPEYIIICNEEIKYCDILMQKILSKLEYKVWIGYALGLSYKRIAELTGISKKSLDNALQRAKNHLRDEYKKNNDLTGNVLKNYIISLRLHEKEEYKKLLA